MGRMKTQRTTDPGRTNPAELEPTDEYVGVDIETRPGDASPRVVFSSVFLLAALGLGAFLLMYSSVHAGDAKRATESTTERTAMAASRQAQVPGTSVFEATPSEQATPGPTATATPTPTPTATATSTPTAGMFSLMVAAPPSAETLRARSLPTPSALIAAPKPTVTVRVEPDPVANPYDTPPTATPPHPSIDAPSNTTGR